MVTNRIIFFATSVQPNPEEIDYWVDLSDNPYGGSIKYFNGTEWVRLSASGGIPDLSNYYTKTQVNNLLNNKADVGDVDSKVDDEEVKDVIKDIQFNTSNSNDITMVMFKYDGSNKTISLPVASISSAGIVTSKDFLDFVKQHQLQELHTEMIDTFADVRAKYQKKLIPGLNIEIDQDTNVISASGDLAVDWDNILHKPDFKPVATSGDYNDLTNKLKPGKDVNISDDNVITIDIDSDELNTSLSALNSKIVKEAETARAAETELNDAITTEKNRAESAENTISTSLSNEISRSTEIDTQHTNAINKEIQDRKDAITTEVNDRNAAILVETNRAKAKEEELDNKITDHTNATNAALALKADKSDTYTKSQVDAKLSGAYKVKGSSTFENLPTEGNVVGDVYNITNAFDLDDKHYDPGTNVVWTEEGWDPLSGSFDTTAIEGNIQDVADDLAQEILDRTQADTTINNSVSSLSNRVKVNEDKLTIINGNESTTGSIANAIKQAKSYTDTTVTAEQTRAQGAEQKLTSDLSSEIARATAAESANATAIQNEINRATGVESTLSADVELISKTKVDKVIGKQLSTEDYTTEEKTKLSGIEDNANNYTLPAATTTTLGGIIVGDRLSIDSTGKLVATYTYTLPTASSSVLGGVKTGSNITNTDGTISLTKANVTSALGVDPTTTYVKKAGDTMTGILNIKNSEGVQLELFSTASDSGAYMRFYPSNQTDNKWYLGVGTNQTVNIGYNAVTKASFGDGQLSLNTSTNLAPIKTNSTTLCTNLNADMVDGKNADEFSERNGNARTMTTSTEIYLKLYTITATLSNFSSYIQFVIGSRGSGKLCTVKVNLVQGSDTNFSEVLISYDNVYTGGKIRGYLVNSSTIEIWYIGFQWDNIHVATSNILASGVNVTKNMELSGSLPTYTQVTTQYDAPEDWYGVSWSETSSSPDCTRIGNMDMHRTLPIQSMMKGYAIWNNLSNNGKGTIRQLNDNWTASVGSDSLNSSNNGVLTANDVNILVKIPEFWYIDEYSSSTKTHNLKICPHAKSGWNHHKEAFVGAYEGYTNNSGYYQSKKSVTPTVNVTRSTLRTAARLNDPTGGSKYNLYTYEEHRAICHLFLVEYATRNSQKAVNTALTVEGFRQGGLGSGCTTGTVTINGATTYSFIPTGSSDSLGNSSGEVTVTIQQTDSSGANTTTTTRKCNRYRGIENPFGHVWKHTDDVISIYNGQYRYYKKCENPEHFDTNYNKYYINLCANSIITGYKTEILITPTCDFFAAACTNGSESTYWCDYNWDNTDTSEHCLLIGGYSGDGGTAGLFALSSDSGVGASYAYVGSRLTYLPWAE